MHPGQRSLWGLIRASQCYDALSLSLSISISLNHHPLLNKMNRPKPWRSLSYFLLSSCYEFKYPKG